MPQWVTNVGAARSSARLRTRHGDLALAGRIIGTAYCDSMNDEPEHEPGGRPQGWDGLSFVECQNGVMSDHQVRANIWLGTKTAPNRSHGLKRVSWIAAKGRSYMPR